ncbi:MAG: hypothetical protein VXZ35_10975, partial [Pseudomonadota bacterium]|nr:hypothetical protein [Pseudomonadota bacterium]
ARRKVENIVNCHPDINYYNCSDGSKITGSEWLCDDDFDKLIESSAMKGNDITDYFFDDEIARVFSHADIQARLNEIRVALHDIRDYCLAVLGDGTNDHYQLGLQAFKIAHYLEKEFTEKHSSVYYFIRGSIWHLLYAGYSHSMGINNKEEQSEFLQHWNQSALDTCQSICEHFENLASRDYTQIGLDDPWLTLYINAVEPPL